MTQYNTLYSVNNPGFIFFIISLYSFIRYALAKYDISFVFPHSPFRPSPFLFTRKNLLSEAGLLKISNNHENVIVGAKVFRRYPLNILFCNGQDT